MKPTDFAIHLTGFLGNYLPAQLNLSPNTIRSYRDVFSLLLCYCRDERGIAPEKLQLKHIDSRFVLSFLEHLQKNRGCGARTRNHRLAVLHSFFKYVQAEEPQLILQCQKILSIPCHRFTRLDVEYLSPDELKAVLAQPDLSTREGRRDAVLLTLLYDTGARVQELIDLSNNDVRLDASAQVRLKGKGQKVRSVPLMEPAAALLRPYMKEHGLDRPERGFDPLFFNRHGNRLTRSGIRYMLKKHVEKARMVCPGLTGKIGPHTLRHTKAMHLLQTGNPISVIQKILGHSDIRTTDVYARADMEMKRKALEKAVLPSSSLSIPSWQNNRELLDWLKSL